VAPGDGDAATETMTETVAALEPVTAPTPPAAEPPAAVAAAPAAAPTPEPRVTPPTAAAPAAQSEPPLRAEPAEPVAVAALPTPALASDFNGAYRVQLLAVRDEAAAAGAWNGLQQRFPGVLGQLRSRVQRADVGDATFFRLQAGPFADRAGASATCEALQQRGTDCFVVEPTS
jgi:hypothetical protein